MKRVIIAGSRTITDIQHVDDAMERWVEWEGVLPDEVVSGGAEGVDTLGEQWAKGLKIPVIRMPAQWMGRDAIKDPSAGRRRNVEMAKYVGKDGYLVAIMQPGGSPGTRHMINAAQSRGLKVYVHKVT